MATKSKRPPSYPLRIDKRVMEALKIVAEEEGRSVNKQIEVILRRFLEDRLER